MSLVFLLVAGVNNLADRFQCKYMGQSIQEWANGKILLDPFLNTLSHMSCL